MNKKEQDNALISVIIPTYNRAGLILRSVESVLASTYKNIEVIVVDDASNDDTAEKISQISDPRLKYIKLEENHGANYARNIGLESASGEYVSFNDSDDIWHEDKLIRLMELFGTLDDSYGMVYSDVVLKKDDSESIVIPASFGHDPSRISGQIFKYMLGAMFISMVGVLVKREVFLKVGNFNEKLKRLQDWELFLRISKEYKVGYLPQTLAYAYSQDDSLSRNYKNMAESIMYVMDLYNAKNEYQRQYKSMKATVLSCISRTDGAEREMLEKEVADWMGADEMEEFRVNQEILSAIGDLGKLYKYQSDIENENRNYLKELFYANVFNSTITGSSWWHYEISPGNMAVGYSFLYALYRILDEIRPKSILELGLGQSSLMTTAYGKTSDCSHIIVEHDESWIDFFKSKLHGNNYDIFTPRLVQNNLEGNVVNMYDDISPVAKGKKYDLIIIDAPFGSDSISRIDTLNYMPEILNDDFIIMLHDAQRQGEQNTITMLENMFKEDGIAFCSGYYSGMAFTYVATSPSLKFLCTL